MVTTQVIVMSAGIVHTKIEFDVVLLPGYSNTGKRTEAKQLIADFLSIANQSIAGSVEIGDLYQILEDLEGVNYSRLKVFKTEPYARPINHTKQLVWTRNVKTTSDATHVWKVIQSNSTHYQLMKDGTFIGTFAYGADISQTEVDFNITANSYDDGDTWQFVTYKYNDNLALTEPSIAVADLSDITLNVTGGI